MNLSFVYPVYYVEEYRYQDVYEFVKDGDKKKGCADQDFLKNVEDEIARRKKNVA